MTYFCAYCGSVSDRGFIQKCRACSGLAPSCSDSIGRQGHKRVKYEDAQRLADFLRKALDEGLDDEIED
jgi:hypothetical protein